MPASALKRLSTVDRKPSADFDFLMGIWKVRHRYLVQRLDDCHDWIEFDGTCAARKILDGFGNMDENAIALPGDTYHGMSLRTYDGASTGSTAASPVACSRLCTEASRRVSAPSTATTTMTAARSAFATSGHASRRPPPGGNRPSRPTKATAGKPIG